MRAHVPWTQNVLTFLYLMKGNLINDICLGENMHQYCTKLLLYLSTWSPNQRFKSSLCSFIVFFVVYGHTLTHLNEM